MTQRHQATEAPHAQCGEAPPASSAFARTSAATALLVAGVMVLSLTMRAPLAGVSPLVGEVRASFGLTATAGSLITAIPVLFLGLVSPLAPMLARRIGNAAALAAALTVLLLGLAVRVVPDVAALFLGGALVGAGIAVLNVLMPVVVKREFPHCVPLMMGVYSTTMVCGAAAAAGVTVPLENAIGHGWRPAMAIWVVLALAGLAVWLPQLRRARRVRDSGPALRASGVWGSPLAWMVTVYMGLQSLLFYVLVAWLPTILADDGMSRSAAAGVLALSTALQIPASLATSLVAGRLRDQRLPLLLAMGLISAGYAGLLCAAPAGAWLWAVLLGVGQGAALALALGFIVLRSADPATVAQLSGMSQAGGYTLAAFGPLAAGAFHDATGGWTVPLAVMLVLAAAATAAGLGASRDRQVRGGPG